MYNHWGSPQSPMGASHQNTQINMSTDFPALANMTFAELEKIEKDSEEISRMVDESDIVKKQLRDKEELMTKIRSLAEYNLSQEPLLNRLKIQLSQTHEQAVEVFKEYDKNKILLDASPSKTSKDVQLALLQTETAKTEEECEELTSKFHSKEMEVEDFVEQYLQRRKLSNMRRIKAEKMAALIHTAPSRAAPARNNAPSDSSPFAFPFPSYQPYNQARLPDSFGSASLPFQPTQPPYPSAVFSGNQAFPQPSLF